MLFWLTVYVLVHVATYLLVIHVISKPHTKLLKNRPDLKDHPFTRTDIEKWNVITHFPFYVFFWPKIIGAWINCFAYAAWVTILMMGVDRNDHKAIGPIRRFLIVRIGQVATRLHALFGGLVWIDIEHVSTGEGDYKKWLGPDWKPEWQGAGAIVANHHSF